MNVLSDLCPPVLSSAGARGLEEALFGNDEHREWKAMQCAGQAIAAAVRNDFLEIGGLPARARLLVLVGKGHNGGDALIAARALLTQYSDATAEVVFAFGERTLRPLAARAWREFVEQTGPRHDVRAPESLARCGPYDLCLDGIFGFQFRPPAPIAVATLLERVNAAPIRFRAAVDLPSADIFRADFTYATGSVKESLLHGEAAGRVRYLDLGFFASAPLGSGRPGGGDRVLTRSVLDSLRTLRSPRSDKRSYGHVFLVGGSRGFPGAILMAVMAAVRSGAGLVSAFVPETLAPAFAARVPEAIWVGWPETPDGSLALEGEHLLRTRYDRADALVLGPGAGRDPETAALLRGIAGASPVPLVIDADALQRDVVTAGRSPRVLTPHAGEYERIAGKADLRAFCSETRAIVVLKGPVTRVSDGDAVYHSFFGGPVLARGGSGDLLAGMIGTQLAQAAQDPLAAAARAVAWHGLAAESLARSSGQVAVATTAVLDHLAGALR